MSQELAKLKDRVRKLEELVEIISRGKYMWESTFDAITAPVQIVSGDYEILRANVSLASVCDREITSIIGKKCYEAFAGRDSPCPGCPMRGALDSKEQTIGMIGGHINSREFEASAYPYGANSSGSVIMHYRDVTEERRLQREVIQQEKMAAIGMLAGGVAHEINNPLGGILAFVQLMKNDAKGNGRLTEDLCEVERAANRCKKIVADLLDFSRVSKGQEQIELDINVLIEKVVPFLRSELKSMNVELEFKRGKDLPLVVGTPDRLQQVFINLMTNACHAMPKGGALTVETVFEPRRRNVHVAVSDTGDGIDEASINRVFEPFFTTKEPGKGTGLGLSISYRIVKDHGGKISCENLDGGGAKFTVTLPAIKKR